MATHLCMFGPDHLNTGYSPCGADSMAGYAATARFMWANVDGEAFTTRVHSVDCGVCLVTAEQMVTAGLAKYVERDANEDPSRSGALLELTRYVSAYAPPGDWWVCDCRPYHPQPLVLPDYAALYPGLRVVEGTEQPRCAFCARERGVVGYRTKFMRTARDLRAGEAVFLTGVEGEITNRDEGDLP